MGVLGCMYLARHWGYKWNKTPSLYLTELKILWRKEMQKPAIRTQVCNPLRESFGEYCGIEIVWLQEKQHDTCSTHRWMLSQSVWASPIYTCPDVASGQCPFSTVGSCMANAVTLIPSFLTPPAMSEKHPIIKHIQVSSAKLKSL